MHCGHCSFSPGSAAPDSPVSSYLAWDRAPYWVGRCPGLWSPASGSPAWGSTFAGPCWAPVCRSPGRCGRPAAQAAPRTPGSQGRRSGPRSRRRWARLCRAGGGRHLGPWSPWPPRPLCRWRSRAWCTRWRCGSRWWPPAGWSHTARFLRGVWECESRSESRYVYMHSLISSTLLLSWTTAIVRVYIVYTAEYTRRGEACHAPVRMGGTVP